MSELSPVIAQAAEHFGLDPAGVRSLGGKSGCSWGAGRQVLRVGTPAVLDAELAAMAAVADVLPVPRVTGRAGFAPGSAVLLERLPGRPAADVARAAPGLARIVGQACGAVHAVLAGVPAPAGLRTAPLTPAGRPRHPRTRVLHLDLHPFNVLADEDGTVTGVLDWANAAAGDALLDRARTWTILTLDPDARARQAEPSWRALTEGWAEAGRLRDVPAAPRAWACRFMLRDLGRRYSRADLEHMRQALRHADAAAGGVPGGKPPGTA